MTSNDGRARSFWAWGYEDRLPDEDTRRGLGVQIGALLGVDPPAPRPLPVESAASLPAPRLALPPSFDPFSSAARRDRISHTYGRAYRDLLRGFQGDFGPAPDAVIYPRDEADIEKAMEHCGRERVALVPFGGGTSVVGGVEGGGAAGFEGVVSLDMRAMGRVLEIEPLSRTARIQAGAFGPAIEGALGPAGLTLRHFPQSFEFSTLGGWIATRAGGHFCTLYTHIDDLVASIRMVTPRGVLESLRLPGSGAGPSPDRMMLGSEGALGVITEAWVRLQPRPRWRASASVLFARWEDGVGAARAVSQSGLFPSNARLLDPAEARLGAVTGGGEAVLLLAFESADHPLTAWMDRALAVACSHGGICPRGPTYREGDRGSDPSAEAWRSAFLQAPYLQSALVSLGVVADTFETACPWDRFAALHDAVTGAVTGAIDRAGARGSLSCRFTHLYPDGPAPYYTFVVVPRPGGELETWASIKRSASDALVEQGATITHHHATGRLHRPWYDRQRPDLFASALRAVKTALDPSGILNPGVLVDRGG